MREFNTTESAITSKSSSPQVGDIISTEGYTTIGDGGGAKWLFNGVTGQTPSQSPSQLGDALFNDASGNQWELVVSGYIEPESVGALGAADDTLPIQAALNSHSIEISKNHEITNLTVPSDTSIIGTSENAGFNGVGLINGRSAGAKNQRFENITLSGELELQVGSTSSSSFAKNITIENVEVDTVGSFGLQAFFIDNLMAEDVRVFMSNNTQGHGFKIGNIKNSTINNFRAEGDVSIGISLSGTSSLMLASAESCDVSNVYVRKNDSYTNISGDHGVYFLGMSGCSMRNITVDGDWTVASTYSIKTRDCHDNSWENVFCKTFRVTADNNTIFLQNTLRNKISNLNCEELLLFKDASASISELTFTDLRATVGLSSNTTDGPVYIKGDVYLGNTGDIRVDGIEFIKADVSIPNIPSTAVFRFGVAAKYSTFQEGLSVNNSDCSLYSCCLNGNLMMDSTGGTTNLLMHNSFVDGDFTMNSFGARVAIAEITNTTINSNENADTNLNPDSKKYRFLAFNDFVYDKLDI